MVGVCLSSICTCCGNLVGADCRRYAARLTTYSNAPQEVDSMATLKGANSRCYAGEPSVFSVLAGRQDAGKAIHKLDPVPRPKEGDFLIQHFILRRISTITTPTDSKLPV